MVRVKYCCSQCCPIVNYHIALAVSKNPTNDLKLSGPPAVAADRDDLSPIHVYKVQRPRKGVGIHEQI